MSGWWYGDSPRWWWNDSPRSAPANAPGQGSDHWDPGATWDAPANAPGQGSDHWDPGATWEAPANAPGQGSDHWDDPGATWEVAVMSWQGAQRANATYTASVPDDDTPMPGKGDPPPDPLGRGRTAAREPQGRERSASRPKDKRSHTRSPSVGRAISRFDLSERFPNHRAKNTNQHRAHPQQGCDPERPRTDSGLPFDGYPGVTKICQNCGWDTHEGRFLSGNWRCQACMKWERLKLATKQAWYLTREEDCVPWWEVEDPVP